MQVGDSENAFGWRDMIGNYSPLRSCVRFTFDDEVRDAAAAIAPRIQPTRDACRIIRYHLRVFRLQRRIALGVSVDDVTWESGANFVVGCDVQLIFGAAPQITQ